jgi:hypothetical protein
MKWGVEMMMTISQKYVFEAATKQEAVAMAREAIQEENHPDEVDFDYMVYEVDDTHTFQGGRL